jgi:hypothetical protein
MYDCCKTGLVRLDGAMQDHLKCMQCGMTYHRLQAPKETKAGSPQLQRLFESRRALEEVPQ